MENNLINQPVAIIDIGSNSVRLVVYNGLKRVPMAIFNEKVLCGLAKDMETTKVLYKDGVKLAYKTIARFLQLAKIMHVSSTYLFATSAVRDANDGNSFVRHIEDYHNVKIEVLTGEQEAKYAGFGVMSSIKNPSGIAADLGGGSLELIEISSNGLYEEGVSFPLGPLRLSSLKSSDKNAIEKYIDNYIRIFTDNLSKNTKKLYFVGGAFRNLARIHMERKKYPLKVIHNYIVSSKDFISTLEIIANMSGQSLHKIKSISKKRLDTLPIAALIALKLIHFTKSKELIFSVHGVREGFLYSKLQLSEKEKDPVISGCVDMIRRVSRNTEYGYDLEKWMTPIFKSESEHEKKLRLAACIVGELACYENTEYRADIAYSRILDSSLIGIDHHDRAFIANTVYCRYKPSLDSDIKNAFKTFIDKKEIKRAQIVGSAMRLGRSFSASLPGVLDKIGLELTKNNLIIHIDKELKDLIGSVIIKRLDRLSEVLNVDYKVSNAKFFGVLKNMIKD